MSAPAQQPPAPPAPPAPPTPPAVGAADPYVVSSASLPGTMTQQDVAMLQARRSELGRQLESAMRRRQSLSKGIGNAEGDVDKAGLESQLTVLDGRIARLESQLDQVGQQLASPGAAKIAGTQPSFRMGSESGARSINPEPILIAVTLFVLSPIAVSISRVIWKRGSARTSAVLPNESAQRLERMEQAMDAIAIEVERVSEGQRFVTRLLSERGGAALAVGQPAAEPVPVRINDASRVR